MRNFQISPGIAVALALVFVPFDFAFAATAPDLGAASGYAVFGKAGSTNAGASTHVWGNVGADLETGITGYLPSQAGGTIGVGTGVESAVSAAYGFLSAQPADAAISLAGTPTVTPGTYTVNAAETLDGTVTLDGTGVYVFRSDSAFTVMPGAKMLLAHGATACNVFWQVPTAMTVGAGAHVVGTIITNGELVSLGTNATLQGRALSRIAAVTLDQNQVTEPVCPPAPATLHVVKRVVNTGGGSAVPSDFSLRVLNSSAAVVGGPSSGTGAPGSAYALPAGTYSVTEDANASYFRSFGGDCAADGSVSLSAGGDKTCELVNTFVSVIPPSGGGGGGRPNFIDACPNGDFSPSYYDGTCGTAPVTLGSGTVSTPPVAVPAADVCLNGDFSPSSYDGTCGTAPVVANSGILNVAPAAGTGGTVPAAIALAATEFPIPDPADPSVPRLPATGFPPRGNGATRDAATAAAVLLVLAAGTASALKKRARARG